MGRAIYVKRASPRVIPAALLLIVLAACGNNEATDPQSGEDGARAEPTPSSASPTEDGEGASEPDPRALGIDTVQWPDDPERAKALFDQMPKQLAGMRGRRHGSGVQYGPNTAGVTAYVTSPGKEVTDPQANLSASFGMGAVCSKDSYAGTAPFMPGSTSRWGIPGWEGTGASGADAGLWWFSCEFMAGEATTFTGHAIGWVSGDLGWLVYTPNKETTEATIEALTNAAE